jgi:DUF1365 family protein
MAFARKGIRKITVNDQRYFWSAKGTDYEMALSVMADTRNGQILNAQFAYSQDVTPLGNGSYSLTNQFVVTPYTVRQVILQGLAEGWRPLARAKPLYLADIERKIDLRLDLNKATKIKEAAKRASSPSVA